MIILSISDINGLYNQFSQIKQMAENSLKELKHSVSERHEIYQRFKNGVLPSYLNAINNLRKIEDSINFSIDLIDNFTIMSISDEIYGKLQLMIIECEKALGILKNKINIPLTENQKNKLNSIRDQIDKLYLDSQYDKNISLAIKHFEQGNFLSCSLISSRIIVYCMDQIPQKNGKNTNEKQKKSKDEKRIDYLVEKNIIIKKDKTQKTRIFKYVHTARNLLVHDIKVFPDASDSMSLLADCVDILKILNKIE